MTTLQKHLLHRAALALFIVIRKMQFLFSTWVWIKQWKSGNWRAFFEMLGKKTKETIIIAIYEKLGRGNSRWPLTHQTNKSLTFSPGKQRVHRTSCCGGVELERESVTGSAVLHRTEASRTGSQLQCDNKQTTWTSTSQQLFYLCFWLLRDLNRMSCWLMGEYCSLHYAFMTPCWFIDSFHCFVKSMV